MAKKQIVVHPNQWLIDAIAKLEKSGAIAGNQDIVASTGYSKAVVSKYVTGKREVSRFFKNRFYEVYSKHLGIVESEGNEPSINDLREIIALQKKYIESLERELDKKK